MAQHAKEGVADRRTASSWDAAGGTDKADQAAGFLGDQADEDRDTAKTSQAAKGLRTAKDLVGVMAKAIAHGLASESDGVKLACLEEVADLGNAARDACRAAMRDAKKETRNLQPST
jgi:hypothetical protein